LAGATNDLFIRLLCNDVNYDILPDGNIITLITHSGKRSKNLIWRKLSKEVTWSGYNRISYKRADLYLHRVIAQKYIGDIEGLEVNHIDGNPSNNHVDNLELVTPSQNRRHSCQVLRKKWKRGNSEITDNVISLIKKQCADGVPFEVLSEQLGISVQKVAKIRSGRLNG
jgi:hypothetical protein